MLIACGVSPIEALQGQRCFCSSLNLTTWRHAVSASALNWLQCLPLKVTKDELVLRVNELNAAVDQLAQNLGGGSENTKEPTATQQPV